MDHRVGVLLCKSVSLRPWLEGLRLNLRAAVGEQKGGIYPVGEVERLAVHKHPFLH